jgi:hypothetical protein
MYTYKYRRLAAAVRFRAILKRAMADLLRRQVR